MLIRDEETRALLRMFGENVRVSRESAGLSVEELAERMKQIDNETALGRARGHMGAISALPVKLLGCRSKSWQSKWV